MSTDISLVKTENYSSIKDDVRRAVSLLGGFSDFVREGQKVLLKPNFFGYDAPDIAITDKRFLKAVIELVKEQGARPYIGEYIASDQPGINKKAFKNLGIIDLAIETGIKIVDFQSGDFREIEIKDPLVMETVSLSEKIKDFDVIINLPKFKGHAATYITGAVKNVFGCIDGRGDIHKNYPGDEFSKAVVDAFSAVSFSLNIMDAVIGMDGDEAPAYGDPAKIGYVIASKDAVAVDAVASKITGHNLRFIPTVRHAHLKKLGVGRPSMLNILGDKPEIRKFKQHSAYLAALKKESHEGFPEMTESCVKCFSCMHNCPVEAIYQKDSELYIDYQKCIRCYRCLESCPYKAIRLKK